MEVNTHVDRSLFVVIEESPVSSDKLHCRVPKDIVSRAQIDDVHGSAVILHFSNDRLLNLPQLSNAIKKISSHDYTLCVNPSVSRLDLLLRFYFSLFKHIELYTIYTFQKNFNRLCIWKWHTWICSVLLSMTRNANAPPIFLLCFLFQTGWLLPSLRFSFLIAIIVDLL